MLTRRAFMKKSTALAALAGSGMAAAPVFKAEAAPAVMEQQYYSHCRMCMRNGCATIVTTRNDVAVDISGNPDCDFNAGTLCARGKSAMMHMYNPYRVKGPMKRTNPKKGLNEDPRWVEITWDEAIKLVSEKFAAIRKNDPKELITMGGFGMKDYHDTFYRTFANVFGTNNAYEANGALCAVHYATNLVQAGMPTPISDYKYCNYTISVGRTAGPNIGSSNGSSRGLPDALDRGMKHVVVDPRCSIEASMKNTEWLPIKPGADLPFCLGFLNALMFENANDLDMEAMKFRSNGPYLIGADGLYARGASGKPQIWDLSDAKAKDFDDATLKDPALEGSFKMGNATVRPGYAIVKERIKSYTPEWQSKITEIPAASVKRIAKEFVKEARVGDTITLNGFTMPFRPAIFICNRGALSHEDGHYVDLVSKMINELVGAMDVPGGHLNYNYGPRLKPNEDGVVAPFFEAVGVKFQYPPIHFDLAEYHPHRHSSPFALFRIVKDPAKYGMTMKPKALFVSGGNPISSVSEPEIIAEGVASIPFTASFAYHLDEICQLSDVLLPENAMLERLSMRGETGCIIGRSAETQGSIITEVRVPLRPIHNTRLAQDIAIDILEGCGALADLNKALNNNIGVGGNAVARLAGTKHELDLGKKYTMKELWDRMLKVAHGEDKGMDWFYKNGIYKERLPEEQSYNYYYYPMGETRFQFYMETLEKSGQNLVANMKKNNVTPMQAGGWDQTQLLKYYSAVPYYQTIQAHKADKKYDLLAFNYKMPTSLLRNGGLDQIPWIVEWSLKNPEYNTIRLNNKTAAAKKLMDGDIIVVESPYGKTEGVLRLTELVIPGSVSIGGATGRKVNTLGKQAASMVHYNSLLGTPDGKYNPVTGAVEGIVPVRVYKKGGK